MALIWLRKENFETETEYLAIAAQKKMSLSVWATEYSDCFSAEERYSPNECPGYGTKPSDGEAPVMLNLWGMWDTLLSPSHSAPLLSGVVAPDKFLSKG